MNASTPRRKDTRQRIQHAALDLFIERGYEKTSLREIAERLKITKAALYYYFKAKEDILVSLFADLCQTLDELIEWGRRQPRTPETKQELLRRYSDALGDTTPILHFAQDNGAALRDLSAGQAFRERMSALAQLVIEADAPLIDNVRGISALFTVHFGTFALRDLDGEPQQKRRAILDVAIELITPRVADPHQGTGERLAGASR
jgi:AcrR family transcriptional regulator